MQVQSAVQGPQPPPQSHKELSLQPVHNKGSTSEDGSGPREEKVAGICLGVAEEAVSSPPLKGVSAGVLKWLLNTDWIVTASRPQRQLHLYKTCWVRGSSWGAWSSPLSSGGNLDSLFALSCLHHITCKASIEVSALLHFIGLLNS